MKGSTQRTKDAEKKVDLQNPEKKPVPERITTTARGFLSALGIILVLGILVGTWPWWSTYYLGIQKETSQTQEEVNNEEKEEAYASDDLGIEKDEFNGGIEFPKGRSDTEEDFSLKESKKKRLLETEETEGANEKSPPQLFQLLPEMKEHFQALEIRLQALEQAQANTQKSVKVTSALTILYQALNSAAPYRGELEAFARLFKDPRGQEMIEKLYSYADIGVLTTSRLIFDFNTLCRGLGIRKSQKQLKEPQSFIQRTAGYLKSLISIKKKPLNQPAKDFRTLLARVRPFIKDGHFMPVIRELEKTPLKDMNGFKAWISHAKARLEIDQYLIELQKIVLLSLEE